MASMKHISRRDLCVSLPAFAVLGASASTAAASQARAPENFAGQTLPPAGQAPAPAPASPPAPANVLAASRAIAFDAMPVRTMANGGESRDIVHGALATGETVNLHQSMQVVGATANAPHVIQHSEFILVREGELEFQHEVAGQMVSEKVGPGGVFYVAFGTRHTVKNVGTVPARYFVVAIGGDAK